MRVHMKYILLVLTLALALGFAGCSRYEVYERNLVYMNAPVFAAEKSRVADQLAQSQRELVQAEASGDPAWIKKAKAAYADAQGQYKAVEWENRSRERSW